jgi:[acyl-carrier-protein] S-malonyltransferase
MREMVKKGVKNVIEIGPDEVLTGLMRRITKGVKTLNLESLKDFSEISQQELEDED